MQWTKQLETGISSIDEQHKELFRQIDILLDASNKDRIAETLDFLGDYVKKHFGDEQVMHAKSKYPKAAEHKKYHDAFVITFKSLKDTYNREGPTLANRMAVDKTLIGWLREHILVQDKDFAAFYKNLAK
jgi:hemerythrin